MEDDKALAIKYDEMYQHDVFSQRLEPIKINRWPTDRYEALVYLARHGGRLLEIGCGRGEVLLTLAPYFDEMVGTELSAVRAERTSKQLSSIPHCQVICATLDELQAKANSPYDCIIWGDVIEHLVDVIGAMKIIGKLSHSGTQLLTVTPNISFLPQRLSLLLGRAPMTHSGGQNEGFTTDPTQTLLLDGGHLHYFSFRQLELLYQISGFRPERRLGFGSRLGRLSNYWPTLLSSSVCVSGTFQGRADEHGN